LRQRCNAWLPFLAAAAMGYELFVGAGKFAVAWETQARVSIITPQEIKRTYSAKAVGRRAKRRKDLRRTT
jgi:hypothetical protein